MISKDLVCTDERRWESPAVPPLLSAPICIGRKLDRLAGYRRNLASPRREQSAAQTPLRRATSEMFAPTSFRQTIGIIFLPGIKHGICHRCSSNDQFSQAGSI